MPDGSLPTGLVQLVGAGPGAADLLTLRAQRALQAADVILHDRLVSDEVLALARPDAERIHVGKARANHCLPQDEINALLIRLARQGRRVVRLKGGDPLIFGRGGEEAAALAVAGIACEIIPGITAALACAADAGIPLTHRDHARTVTFATGHTREGMLDLDFATLAALGGTLVIYMGLTTLPGLRDGFLAHGLPAGTPAALVERGGTSRRRMLTGTLDTLPIQAATWSRQGPALVIIGSVVASRARLAEVAAMA
jgi:uroporphyrin-III C-methyltransferase/precorrin-2 dehydrogenase/sirohydrochlorin ferrochelatase